MAMSPQIKAEILESWNAGLTADRIAKALGGRYSRSAVLGVIHRARQAGVAVRGDGADAPAATPAPPAEVALTLGLPPAVHAGLAAIAAEGRWVSVEACAASMLAAIVADDARAHLGARAA